jgi:hypothetical protein
MSPIDHRVFDMYALSLPYGLDFGDNVPVSLFQSGDGLSFGAVLRNELDGRFGFFCMRRRVDQVWAPIGRDGGFRSFHSARVKLARVMRDGLPLEPVPPGIRKRPDLFALGPKGSSAMFDFVGSLACLAGAWAFHEAYLALPNPDANWVSDCQTSNFHTRLWEAYLNVCFREQGCTVTQAVPSPDFHVSDNFGHQAWIEAVTANAEPFDHSNAEPVAMPDYLERQIGSPAIRFSRTLRSKLQRRYDLLPHVAGIPFAIALADYHAPGSMLWSRTALPAYLYGVHMTGEQGGSGPVGIMQTHSTLMGEKNAIRSGLFLDPENSGLSAVIFSNDGAIGKFNRMGFFAGIGQDGVSIKRAGIISSRVPGRGLPTRFDLDIASAEYAALMPDFGEIWSLELDVFHNPLATNPLAFDLLPECTHWYLEDGEVLCRYAHEHSVLGSLTLISAVAITDGGTADGDCSTAAG